MLAPRTGAPNVHSEGIGAALSRREDRRFPEGKGQYVADIHPVNALSGDIVRHLDMPYSAPRIWQTIHQARRETAH